MRTIGYTEFVALTREVNTGGIIKLCNIVNLYGAPNNAYGFDNARIVCCGGKFVNIPPQGVTASTITISFGNTTLEGDTNGIFDCTAGGNIKVEGGVNGRTYELRWWKLSNDQLVPELFTDNTGFITYVINKQYNLTGTITLSRDCNLKFLNNSRISGGTIVGNNTYMDAPRTNVIGSSLTLNGTWRVDEAYPEWFGAQGYNSAQTAATDFDNINAINRCLTAFGKATFTTDYICKNTYNLIANSTLIFKGGRLVNNTGSAITLTCDGNTILSQKSKTDTFSNISLAGSFVFKNCAENTFSGISVVPTSSTAYSGDNTISFIEVTDAIYQFPQFSFVFDTAESHKASIVIVNTAGKRVDIKARKRTATGSVDITGATWSFQNMTAGGKYCIELLQVGETVHCTRYEQIENW